MKTINKMNQSKRHQRLFNDVDDKATSFVIQQIQQEQTDRTTQQVDEYSFDFFKGQPLQNKRLQWEMVQVKECAVCQTESEIEINDYETPAKRLDQERNIHLFQDIEEDFDIAEEEEINQPNGSQIDFEVSKEDKSLNCDSPSNRKTLMIYPDMHANINNLQSRQPELSISSSISTIKKSQISVTQGLRLSCLTYLESISTVAEEEEFSLDQIAKIRLYTQSKKKIFEEEVNIQNQLQSQAAEQQSLFNEPQSPTQFFDVWQQIIKQMIIMSPQFTLFFNSIGYI